jgi:hypothetical protein
LRKQKEAAAFENLKTISTLGNGARNGDASGAATDATPLQGYHLDEERRSASKSTGRNGAPSVAATPRSDQIKNGQAHSEDRTT